MNTQRTSFPTNSETP